MRYFPNSPQLLVRCVALCAVLMISSCPQNQNLVLGPFSVIAPVGDASFLQTLFTVKGGVPISTKQKFCDMPSETELEEEVLQVGDFDLSRYVQLHELHLVHTKVTATSGDFSFITRMQVRFIPKPGSGNAVVIGVAENPNGFDSEIVLEPDSDVDFLQLIRANDAGDPDTCPKLEFTITFSRPPLSDVAYHVDAAIDAYVEVTRQ